MRLSNEQKVGLFFVAGLVLFVAFVELTVGTGLFRGGIRLWADFRDVQGLTSGAPVRVSGVRVGSVGDVVLEPDRVRVALDVDDAAPIHRDAVARLDFQALSGARFLSVDPGTPEAGRVADGGTLRTETAAGISQMVDELQKVGVSVRDLADSLNANQDRLLRSLSEMLDENQQALTSTVQNLASISEKLASGQGTLGKLLVDASLYDEATAALTEIRESFGDIRKVTGQLASGRGALGHLLNDEELYFELEDAVGNLRITAENFALVSDQVRRGDGTLGRLVADDSLYLQAESALHGVTRATQGIEDQAPISVLGTLLGTLF